MSTRPSSSSALSASRSDVRETPSLRASSRSPGSRCPAANSPASMRLPDRLGDALVEPRCGDRLDGHTCASVPPTATRSGRAAAIDTAAHPRVASANWYRKQTTCARAPRARRRGGRPAGGRLTEGTDEIRARAHAAPLRRWRSARWRRAPPPRSRIRRSRSGSSCRSRRAAHRTCSRGSSGRSSPSAWGSRWWSRTSPARRRPSAPPRSRAPRRDGYTLMLAPAPFVIARAHVPEAHAMRRRTSRASRCIASSPLILTAHPSVGAERRRQELLALAKAKPGYDHVRRRRATAACRTSRPSCSRLRTGDRPHARPVQGRRPGRDRPRGRPRRH